MRVRKRVSEEEATTFVELLRRGARVIADPAASASRSADPGDEYLIVLAEAEHALLVSGDQHLLALADEFPIQTARAFLDTLAETYAPHRHV